MLFWNAISRIWFVFDKFVACHKTVYYIFYATIKGSCKAMRVEENQCCSHFDISLFFRSDFILQRRCCKNICNSWKKHFFRIAKKAVYSHMLHKWTFSTLLVIFYWKRLKFLNYCNLCKKHFFRITTLPKKQSFGTCCINEHFQHCWPYVTEILKFQN